MVVFIIDFSQASAAAAAEGANAGFAGGGGRSTTGRSSSQSRSSSGGAPSGRASASFSSSVAGLNPLGRRLRSYVWRQLHAAAMDPTCTSIVLTGGAAQNFSAGADLTEFAAAAAVSGGDILPTAPAVSRPTNRNNNHKKTDFVPTLIDIVDYIASSPKPIVACIQGACLGGGLEIALACHYRIASNSHTTQLGLPEVHVGVIPGAGGTQRLPRLIGLSPALTLIVTGAPVTAAKALALSLVDAIVEEEKSYETNDQKKQQQQQQEHYNVLLSTAKKWALWAETVWSLQTPEHHHQSTIIRESPAVAHTICHIASLSLPLQHLGGHGVRAALEAVRASFVEASFAHGMRREGELFRQVLTSSQGQARRHAFFAVRTAQQSVSLRSSSSRMGDSDAATRKQHALLSPTSSVFTAVIGAGTMGGGIALVLLQAGFSVILVDVAEPALKKGVTMIHAVVQSYVHRKRLTPTAAAAWLSRLTATQNLHDLSQCHLVVEAVVEKMAIKQQIFRTLNKVTPPHCLLLSNTSTLDIDVMASVLDEPRRQLFAGWHFFSPAHVMKLVEIVVGSSSTSSETTAVLQALTKRIGKIGVVVGNCDGFCGNRLLRPYSAETVMLLVEDNASIETVDAAFVNFGMALGPFQLSDLAGNDIGYNIRRERGWVREDPASPTVPAKRPNRYTELADDMVSQLGRLGQKAGKGWYDYDPAIGKGRKALVSQEMTNFVKRYRSIESFPTNEGDSNLSEHEILERVFYPLVNEGFKCLEEGIARCPSDIDVVYLYGYGWPVWRGGPMYWADHEVGLPVLLAKLQEFHRRYPCTEHYEPSKLLVQCVSQGKMVEEFFRDSQQARSRL